MGEGGGRNGRSGRAGPGRAGPGRVATETGIRNRAPSKRAQEKIRRSGTPLTPILLPGSLKAVPGGRNTFWEAENSPARPKTAAGDRKRPREAQHRREAQVALGSPKMASRDPKTIQTGAGKPKSPSRAPKWCREAQNRRPQIGHSQCGNAGVEMPGQAGSGRVATETGIRNRPPSNAPRKKYAVRANPSLRYIYIYVIGIG